MWVRHRKRICMVGRAYLGEVCTLASGFGASFVWVFVTPKKFSLETNKKENNKLKTVKCSRHA